MRTSRRRIRRWGRPDLVALVVALVASAGLVFGQADDEDRPDTHRAEAAEESPIYPDRSGAIRFDHDKHAGVPCSRCHAQASTSTRASDDLGPSMQACAGCHASTTEPELKRCGACHTGHPDAAEDVKTREQWDAVRPAPMPMPRPQSEIRFPHRAHVEQLLRTGVTSADAACATCHRADGEKMTFPEMDACMNCHDGSTAPDDCTSCHPTAGATGRVKTTINVGGQTRHLKPDDHTVDWKERHATVAKANAAECASCHTEEDCATCHVEKVAKPFSVHPPSFLTIHAANARADLGNCTDCHDTETFCTSCHARAKALPESPNSPPPKLDYHPSGWLDASMPNNHGVMARRNITECASCHQENDCVTCHTGVNPHPPEFRVNCRRLFEANPRPCAKCHSDLRALQTRCL